MKERRGGKWEGILGKENRGRREEEEEDIEQATLGKGRGKSGREWGREGLFYGWGEREGTSGKL